MDVAYSDPYLQRRTGLVAVVNQPDDLRRAYETAMGVGPRWREHIANSLKRMPETMNTLNSI